VSIVGSTPTPKENEWIREKSVTVLNTPCTAIIVPAAGLKCPRCWIHRSESLTEPCKPCVGVLSRFSPEELEKAQEAYDTSVKLFDAKEKRRMEQKAAKKERANKLKDDLKLDI